MFRRLIHYAGQTCAQIGRRVISRLRVDPRLAEVTTEFGAAQAALESRVTARSQAEETERNARNERDHAAGNAALELREFGLVLLCKFGNNHRADDYLRYFPDGYGDLSMLDPSQVVDFGNVILGKLAQETDPRLTVHQAAITAARDALLASEAACQAAQQAQQQANAYLAAEKRLWVRALISAHSRVQSICFGEKAYIRGIFAPGYPRRSRSAPDEMVPEEVPAAPSIPSLPQTSPTPAAPSEAAA
jgi:hypothetical protein